MRVAFCGVSEATDPSYWSGTPYFMARHLAAVIPDLVHIAPLQLNSQPFKEKHALYSRIVRETYLWELEPVVHRLLSAEVERRLRGAGKVDAIIAPGCFPYPNIFLRSEVPTIFWTDATFSGLLNVHPGYKNVCAENIWCGQQLQRKMLDGAYQAVFSSQWAADSAVSDYAIDGAKVHNIPFGANLHFTIESEAQLQSVLSNREGNKCRLLFVAGNWQDKGGDFALSVHKLVREAGIDALLTVVGCVLPAGIAGGESTSIEVLPSFVKDGSTSERTYVDLLASSHFLLHPSRGDCFGITMCEANAWGVPVLSRLTGGAQSIVVNGENGWCFAADASAEDYANLIVSKFNQRSAYLDFCRSSWRHYSDRLNWMSSAELVARLLPHN